MKATASSLLAAVLLSACGASEPTSSPSGDRYVNKDQHYSVNKPEGWEVALVRGSAQFAPSAQKTSNAKHTIVVRGIEKPRELKEGNATSTDDVVSATEKVLRALPRASLGERKPASGSDLPGAQFTLTFTPSGMHATYRRDQAVLVGSKHIYHVIYTAPAGEPIDDAAFKNMVATLNEEG